MCVSLVFSFFGSKFSTIQQKVSFTTTTNNNHHTGMASDRQVKVAYRKTQSKVGRNLKPEGIEYLMEYFHMSEEGKRRVKDQVPSSRGRECLKELSSMGKFLPRGIECLIFYIREAGISSDPEQDRETIRQYCSLRDNYEYDNSYFLITK